MAKVLLLNGSPHAKGCTATALEEMKKVLEENGIKIMREIAEKSSLEDVYFRLIGGSNQ